MDTGGQLGDVTVILNGSIVWTQKEIRRKSHFIETWTCSCKCKKKKEKKGGWGGGTVNMKKHFGDIFLPEKKALLG